MNFTEFANVLFGNNEIKKVSFRRLDASLARSISEAVSRAIIETKLPLLSSAVADKGEGPLFRVKINSGRKASTYPSLF